MNKTEEIMEEYKSAVRMYIRHSTTPLKSFYEGRLSGFEVALGILGIDSDGIRDMYKLCEEETMDVLAQEEHDR